MQNNVSSNYIVHVYNKPIRPTVEITNKDVYSKKKNTKNKDNVSSNMATDMSTVLRKTQEYKKEEK